MSLQQRTAKPHHLHVVASLLLAGIFGASQAGGAVTVEVDHTCGRGTGHEADYKVTVTGGSGPVYQVYFPRPRFQRSPRPLLASTGAASEGAWTYTETTVRGQAVGCFRTSTTPIPSGSCVTFTITATLGQTVAAGSRSYKVEGGGLRSGRSWYFSESTDEEPPTRGGTTSAINGSGQSVPSSRAQGGADLSAPDHMVCTPAEFSGVPGDCDSITFYVFDDGDPNPTVECSEIVGGVRLTVTDAFGNTDSSDYIFVAPEPVPLVSDEVSALLFAALVVVGCFSIVRRR